MGAAPLCVRALLLRPNARTPPLEGRRVALGFIRVQAKRLKAGEASVGSASREHDAGSVVHDIDGAARMPAQFTSVAE